jgi:hypothetical protein
MCNPARRRPSGPARGNPLRNSGPEKLRKPGSRPDRLGLHRRRGSGLASGHLLVYTPRRELRETIGSLRGENMPANVRDELGREHEGWFRLAANTERDGLVG